MPYAYLYQGTTIDISDLDANFIDLGVLDEEHSHLQSVLSVEPVTTYFWFNQATGLLQFDFLALFEASIEANAAQTYTISIKFEAPS